MRPPRIHQDPIQCPLDSMLGAEARVRLLRSLATPGTQVTLSRLAREVGLGRRGAALAAEKLIDAGIVSPVGTGGGLIEMNWAHPLAAPLRQLFESESRRERTLRDGLKGIMARHRADIEAAWIGRPIGADGASRASVRIVVLTRGRNSGATIEQVEEEAVQMEVKLDAPLDICGVTRADLQALPRHEQQWIRDAQLLWSDGSPPLQETARPSARAMSPERQAELLAAEIARKIREDPRIVERARQHVRDRMSEATAPERRELRAWDRVLMGTPARVRALLTEKSARASRLRKSLPFLDVLTQREREAVLERGDRDD